MTQFVALLLVMAPTMSGPPVALRTSSAAADYFASLLTSVSTECDGSALTMSDGTSVSVSRASSAYCTASTGTMTLVTSNAPRVSTTGLHIEGARTNSILRSQELDNASWPNAGGNASNPTVTANASAAPDGTTTAEQVDFQAVAAGQKTAIEQAVTGTAATWTASLYVKGVSGSGTVYFYGTPDDVSYVIVTCAYTSTAWTRCSNSGTLTAVNWYWQLGVNRSNATMSAGIGASSIYVWGVQVEAGSGVSSYIPTAGTTVARANDAISVSPATSIDAAGCSSATVTYGATFPGVSRWLNTSAGSPLSGSNSTSLLMHDNLNTTTRAVADMTGRAVTARSGWSGTATSLAEGGNTSTGTFDGTMGGNPIYLGSQGGTSNFIFGHIKSLKLGTSSTGCAP